MKLTRRRFFAFLAGLPFIGLLAGVSIRKPNVTLTPTPACDDHDEPTPSQTEGPYFTPNSPERSNLRDKNLKGTVLVLTGKVLNTNCQPVGRALLDWWHADDAGNYDNNGYTLRGHHYTDKQGNFRLETIVPGLYPGRTRHLHVKIQAPNKPVLTTQLYFPDEPGNKRDGIFKPILIMEVKQAQNQMEAGYTFVLKA
jgi:protocatechuate 3,4-dioxygenase beta subunit